MLTNLVNLRLGMIKQRMEVLKNVVVEHNLSLLISASDNITNSPQCCRHHFNILMTKQWNEIRHKTGIDHHLNDIIAIIGKIRNRPNGIDQNLSTKNFKNSTSSLVNC